MKRTTALIFLCITTIFPQLSHAEDIIIDNVPPLAVWSEYWGVETPTSAYGVNAQRASNPDAWAQWAFTEAPPGEYQVYLWWPTITPPVNPPDTTANAEVTSAAGVVENLTIDQSVNGGQWNLIGTWDLDAASKVKMTNGGSGKVYFDAVKLVTVAADPPVILSMTASPVHTAVISWASQNATSCMASGSWSGSKPLVGNETVSNTGEKIYGLECNGLGIGAKLDVTVGTPEPEPPAPECSDGFDNDDPEDTLADMADPGCEAPTDASEVNATPECSDGVDNADTEDTLIDMADPGCEAPADTSEVNTVVECNDGIDNADTEDTLIDLADPGCVDAADNSEVNAPAPVECNDGVDNADTEDTLIDMADPGCTAPTDTSEVNAATECSDGIDNADTEDTLIDLADPGCTGSSDTSEVNAVVQCNDGIDNADPEDTLIDMADPGCVTPTDTSEVDTLSNKIVFGLNVQQHTGTFNDAGKQFTKELGVESVRLAYDHGDYNAGVNWAAANGVGVLFNFGYGAGCGPKTPEGRQCYANRSANLAQDYGNKVQYYEVWNEWNGGIGLGCHHGQAGTACVDYAMYTDLLCRTYKAVKAVRPQAKIVGGVTAGVDINFLTQILNRGAGDCMDMVSVHPYIFGTVGYEAPVTTAVNKWIERINAVKSLIVEKTGANKPVLVTEDGRKDGYKEAQMQRTADYITELFNRAPSVTYMEGIWWFELKDNVDGPWGLLRGDNTKKPGFHAYKNAVQ